MSSPPRDIVDYAMAAFALSGGVCLLGLAAIMFRVALMGAAG